MGEGVKGEGSEPCPLTLPPFCFYLSSAFPRLYLLLCEQLKKKNTKKLLAMEANVFLAARSIGHLNV